MSERTTSDFPDLLSELRWRGLLHQATDEAALAEHFATGTRKVYCGFDPTADSLTIGNLVPIMLLKHVQRHGHTPIVVMGGATGRIGDPSGKSAERTLMTDEQVDANIAQQRGIFERVLGAGAMIVNNLDWWKDKSFLWVLREVGKHFSVNVMMQKDSVRDRLHNRDQGISFTEFSYQILQGYDFLHLAREEGVTVQCGGSDQWGNIVAGTDLIAREFALDMISFRFHMLELMAHAHDHGDESSMQEARILVAAFRGYYRLSDEITFPERFFSCDIADQDEMLKEFLDVVQKRRGLRGGVGLAFTAPLVTKADGGKFGKSEAGAVWLSGPRTSAYAFHQFWLNAADADVERYLKMFTLLPKAEIEAIVREHAESPEKRVAQRALADAATAIVHGEQAVDRANAAANALFSGEVAGLDADALREVFSAAPSSGHEPSTLDGDGWSVIDALVDTGLASSKSQAREFVKNGAVTINGQTRAALDTRLTRGDLLHDEVILLRRGKKNWHVCRFA